MNRHTDIVCSLVVLSSDVIASGSRDTKIIIWQVSTGQQLQTLSGHGNSRVSSLGVLKDGRLISVGFFLRIWS